MAQRHRNRRPAVAIALGALIVVSCTSGDGGGGGERSAAPATPPDGPAPGVTDDVIRVGVTYVDADAVRQFVDLDQGDFEASYRAVIDDVNAAGGIHGRAIEPVFVPVNP